MTKKALLPDETASVRDLRARIKKGENILKKTIAAIEGLKLEIVAVQREYESRIEPLVIKIALLDEQIFELKKVRDLINKGMSLPEARRTVRERDRLRTEHERERVAEEHYQEERDRETVQEQEAPNTPEIKKLWRLLAYRFHPDLTRDAEEKNEREAIMKQVNAAYVCRNIERLRELSYGAPTETVFSANTTDEFTLKERLLDIDENLRRVNQRLTAFRRSPWYKMRLTIERAKRARRDYFAELKTAQEIEIAAREKLIARVESEIKPSENSLIRR